MDHAHPFPDEFDTPSRQSCRPSYSSGVVQSSPKSANPSPLSYEILNPQTRILQLRHAGFRGPIISGRRISPVFGPSLHDSYGRPPYDENSPRTLERRILYGEDLPPNPVNILQEIHNSSRRRHISPITSFSAISQDNTNEQVTQEAGGLSWYSEGSNNCSPSPSNREPVKMIKLRERTRNETTPPPLSSPLVKQVKRGKPNRSNLRSTSFEASTYIEHLESQLSAVNAKLDSLMSPATNRARSAKLRALTVETRSLRQEVSDWEKKFEDRVEEEIHTRVEYETGMKLRIQCLEDEMETKDSKMRELEWEIDGMRNKVKDAEGLEVINLNLERRIDVLTSLVVQSPTKVDLCSATPSPNKADPPKQTPRPKSMLPRMQSSPGGVRLSLNTKVEAAFWDSKRFASASSISESPGGASNSIEEEDENENLGDHLFQGLPSRPLSCASASFRSLPSFSTRPTTCLPIAGLKSPDLSSVADFESQTRSANRQRRMRRFPSGSCTLKPLILPSAAATPSLPASVALHADPGRQYLLSSASLDPTIAFLSKNDDSSPVCTPTQPPLRRSATWTPDETINAPKGNSEKFDAPRRGSLCRSFVLPPHDLWDTPSDAPEHRKSKRARPLSLDKELELAEYLSPNQFEDGLIAADVEEASKFESIPIGIEPSCTNSLPDNSSHYQTSKQPNITPKLNGKHGVAITSNFAPSTMIKDNHALGIFARLTSLISRVNQDPVILARQLLCNAWNLGASRLGGIRWWLLGLIFRSYRRRVPAADRKTVEEQSVSIFNWPSFSAQASRSRTVEHSLRNQGEFTNDYELAFRKTSRTQETSSQISLSTATISQSPPSRTKSHLLPCNECVESSFRQSFRLWFNFSLAIVLTVGVAIKHGPGILLTDQTPRLIHVYHKPSEREILKSSLAPSTCGSESTKVGSSRKVSGESESKNADSLENEGIVFAEILGPEDFEHHAIDFPFVTD